MPKIALDAAQIEDALRTLVDSILQNDEGPFAIVGIRRGGDHLAARLTALIEERTGVRPALGAVDVTLYRDDGFGPNDWPTVGVTSLPYTAKDHTVVLVDDVLYTGRTVRAALGAILDYGRSKAVRLVVLVDRGLRQLPIAADAVGVSLETDPKDHVTVKLGAAPSPEDVVLIEPVGNGQ